MIPNKDKVQLEYLKNEKDIRISDETNGKKIKQVRVASLSRLIIFMAGHAAVAIGSSLASFIIYFKLVVNTGDEAIPNLNGLVGVLLALGIGVVPYAINRLSSTKNEGVQNSNS